ncbi:peptidase S9 prolyl oligopeptidase [Cordyceps fumosorosea ARSEF 2679]|uniref:Dipeptidyl-peptidase V n=1 Tax=Cordyceps fumosorosea (strain ARSEF 2679) TaxID=1081104 RepID=A0A168ENX2_CORFA|nr:peptidase S9 prolyl oligopeptidase [Cordyceps fumosorosea ARSEF 2679]OAA74043.1 peptidase S9 prolyl oligopeptidase [Cordyceps fumosorosea ARSEF 2679]
MSTSADTALSVAAAASGYKQPPSNILDVMRAPALPVPVPSPAGDRIILVSYAKYPSISHIATAYLALAGVRVEIANRNRRNTAAGHGIRTFAYKLELVQAKDGKTVTVSLPPDARTTSPIWSADGRYFAFENITPNSVDLWIGSGETGVARQVQDVGLNPLLEHELIWMPSQKQLLVKLVPKGQQPQPAKPTVPLGPIIQETDGKKGQSSTYEARDTLKNEYDEALFDYYAASQLALVDVESLTTQPIGEVDLYLKASASPDGNYMFTLALRKDYSYNTGYLRFPYTVKVWNLSDLTSTKPLNLFELPLADRVPIRGVPCGPRDFSWRSNAPASLLWVEALDDGNWEKKVEHRDKVMLLEAPFDINASRELLRTEYRFGGLAWGEDPSFAILRELDINTQWERRYIVNVGDPQQERKLILDMSYNERYKYPGSTILRKLPNGFHVVRKVGESIFLSGAGSSKDGDRPFLDQFNTDTRNTRRLFRSSSSAYESFIGFTDTTGSTFLTLHESPTDSPNVFQHILRAEIDAPEGEAVYSTESRAVTNIPNPTPLLSQIKKRVVTYQREDGVQLSFNLHTPPGYQEGTRVPTILYAYPRDFASGSEAGQVTGSQARFTRLRKHQFLLLAGYAILENAAFPIVGDPKKAYDTYLEQLVANAKAAVDKAVEIGVADPERVGVTGHSHGALMTANLLAHSDIFKAGVATSGAYNKTLTPFGFQNERRSVWEAPEPYRKASTFFFADKLKHPILIVHGADDANPGTTPMQSSNFYSAVRGNGGTAKLVMLPHEPHHYEAKESHEHVIHEMLAWFDKYLKYPAEAQPDSKI